MTRGTQNLFHGCPGPVDFFDPTCAEVKNPSAARERASAPTATLRQEGVMVGGVGCCRALKK